MCDLFQPVLDGVGDVGNHLNRLAQVIASTFGLNHLGVNFPRGEVVVFGEVDVKEPLVVAEVKVDLTAVVQDKHFPVLEGGHGARIAVEVRVDFD